jgi:hypothetical protein
MNKEFLKMQKTAGIITENQYNQKVKALNEETAIYTSKVDWYYIEEYSDYPGPKGRVVPDAPGYDNPKEYEGTELYIAKGTQGLVRNNQFEVEESGNTVPFESKYFEFRFNLPDDEGDNDDEFGHYDNPEQGWNIDDEY